MKATGFKPVGRVKITPLDPVVTWITSASLPGGSDDTAYTTSLHATVDTTSLTVSYAVISGSLPTGISLGSNGIFSGTPSVAGTATFTVRATAGRGFADREFTIVTTSALYNWAANTAIRTTLNAPASYGGSGGASMTRNGTAAFFGKLGGGTGLQTVLYNSSTNQWELSLNNVTGLENTYHVARMSGDGLTIGVGAPGVTSSQGNMRIYTRPSVGNVAWTLRQTVTGPGTNNNYYGQNIAISDDGSRVVTLGLVTKVLNVFTRNGAFPSTFTQSNVAIPGSANFDFGLSNYNIIDISGNGNTVVLGAPNSQSNNGRVSILESDGSNWYGTTLIGGEAGIPAGQRFGGQVNISQDGQMVFVMMGQPATTSSPRIYVFKRNALSDWQLYGSMTPTSDFGSGPQQLFMAIDATGTTVAALNGTAAIKRVVLFRRAGTSSTWTEIATMTHTDTGFGSSIALNAAGDKMTIGNAGTGAGKFYFYGK